MNTLLTVSAVAVVAGLGTLPVPASADPNSANTPPFIDHTQWTQWQRLTSLRVYPTPSGRAAARRAGSDTAADEAWSEVLATTSNADTPGMRAQFICHWQLAEIVQPGKTSWNLEPWRPVVDDAEMVASGCNPDGQEEPF